MGLDDNSEGADEDAGEPEGLLRFQPLFEYLRRTARRFHTTDTMWAV